MFLLVPQGAFKCLGMLYDPDIFVSYSLHNLSVVDIFDTGAMMEIVEDQVANTHGAAIYRLRKTVFNKVFEELVSIVPRFGWSSEQLGRLSELIEVPGPPRSLSILVIRKVVFSVRFHIRRIVSVRSHKLHVASPKHLTSVIGAITPGPPKYRNS